MTGDSDLDADNRSFTILDWIGVALALAATAALFAFSFAGPAYLVMFEELDATLPFLTRWVTRPWVPPVLSLVPLACAGLGVTGAWSLARRRLLVVLAFVAACALLGLCIVGVYLPMFELSSAIGE